VERRKFIVKAGGVLVAAGAAAVVDAPNVIAQPKFRWRMPTTWPPALDVLQGSAQRLAAIVDEMSGGRFKIEVAPAGQIMPALGVFDAASQGTVDVYIAGIAGAWATGLPVNADGSVYVAQPVAQPLLPAGTYSLSAIFVQFRAPLRNSVESGARKPAICCSKVSISLTKSAAYGSRRNGRSSVSMRA